MVFHTSGFLLNKLKYGETSLILKVYSKEFGLISIIKKEANSIKTKKKLLFYPLSEVDLVLYKKDNQRLYNVNKWDYINLPKSNIKANSILLFLAEFMTIVLADQDKNEAIYDFIKKEIIRLHHTPFTNTFALGFMAKFTQYLGILPNFSEKKIYFNLLSGHYTSEKDSLTLNPKLNNLWEAIFINNKQEITIETRKELMEAMLRFYELQLDGFKTPKSLKIILDVFIT